jgi:proteic killer suppression protein
MKIEYANKHLARLFTDEAHKMGLPISVIKAARLKVLQLEWAPDERTLRNLAGLRYKKLGGEREGQRQIRVNDQYRIVFLLLDQQQPPTIRILEIDDPH